MGFNDAFDPAGVGLVGLLGGVSIHEISNHAGGHNQVLIAVEIHIGKRHAPTPLRCPHAGVLRNFRVTAVPTREVQRVLHNLWSVLHQAYRHVCGLHETHLGFTTHV